MTAESTSIEPEMSLTDFVKDYARSPSMLIIEDDLMAMTLMTDLLKNFEVEVSVCHTGRCGCQLMDVRQFDLIVLDLGLPDRSYESVARHIADTQTITPVIVLSGHIDERCVTTCNAILNRPVWYIQKPFGFAVEHWIRVFEMLRIRAAYKGKVLSSALRLK